MDLLLLVECVGTADEMRIAVLDSAKEIAQRQIALQSSGSQHVVDEIMTVFTQHPLDLHQVVGIAVVQGAQRFTTSRVIAVTLNALSFSLNVPIKEYEQLPDASQLWSDLQQMPRTCTTITPRYSADPRITFTSKPA